ncbi:MAG: DUF6132 family protein [Bacteroidales bacterium]
MVKNLFKKYGINLLFALAGAVGGYFYWYYIGCKSGTCPITSVWYSTSLYGALLGYLVGDLVISVIKKAGKKKLADNK